MSIIFKIIILGIQVVVTFLLLIGLYMIFALLDYNGGFDGFIGLTIFQPIMAIIFSALTIIGCLILGLPIRIVTSAREWWIKNFYLAIVLSLIGIALLVLSLMPPFLESRSISENGSEFIKEVPNMVLAVSGWFLTAFSVLHTFPPKHLSAKAQLFMSNLTGLR